MPLRRETSRPGGPIETHKTRKAQPRTPFEVKAIFPDGESVGLPFEHVPLKGDTVYVEHEGREKWVVAERLHACDYDTWRLLIHLK